MAISPEAKSLYKFMNTHGLLDMTQADFGNQFNNSAAYETVYNKLVSNNLYDGSLDQFLTSYVTKGVTPLALKPNQVRVDNNMGVQFSLPDRIEMVSKNRYTDDALKDLEELMSDLSSNSILDEESKNRISTLSFSKSGKHMFDVKTPQGEVVSTFDYAGFGLGMRGDERNNRVQSVVSDVLSWAQEKPFKESYDQSQDGAGLRYDAPIMFRDKLGNVTSFQSTAGFRSQAGGIISSQFQRGSSVQPAFDLEDGDELEAQQLTAQGFVPFNTAERIYGTDEFNINQAVESAKTSGKRYTINGEVYETDVILPTTGTGISRDNSGNMIVNIDARKVSVNAQTGKEELGPVETVTLKSKYELDQFARGQTNLDFDSEYIGQYEMAQVINDLERLVNLSKDEGAVEDEIDRIEQSVTDYVSTLPDVIRTSSDRDMYKMEIIDPVTGEEKTVVANNKQEMFGYLLQKRVVEEVPQLKDFIEVEELLSRLKAGTKYKGKGAAYSAVEEDPETGFGMRVRYGEEMLELEMNPFVDGFFLQDADYSIDELISVARDGYFLPRGKRQQTADRISDYVNEDSDYLSQDLDMLNFSDEEKSQSTFALVKQKESELENYDKIQNQIAKYYQYYSDLYSASILAGNGSGAEQAREKLEQLEDVSYNLIDSPRFEYLRQLDEESDRLRKRFDDLPDIIESPLRFGVNLGASVLNTSLGLGQVATQNLAGVVRGVTGTASILGLGSGADEAVNNISNAMIDGLGNIQDNINSSTDILADRRRVPVYDGYVNHDGYKVFFDSESGEINRILKSDFSIPSIAETKKVKEDIYRNYEGFTDKATKARNWYNPRWAGVASGVNRTVADLVILVSGGGLGTTAIKGSSLLPKGASYLSKAGRKILTYAPSASIVAGQMYNGLRTEALSYGFDEDEANTYASTVSIGVGYLNMMFGGLEKNLVGLGTTMSPIVRASAGKMGGKEAARITLKEATSKFLKGAIKEGTLETIEETYLEHGLQLGYHSLATAMNKKEIEPLRRSSEETKETALISFIVGFGGGAVGKVNDISNFNSASKTDIDDLMMVAAKNKDESLKAIANLERRGIINASLKGRLESDLELADRSLNKLSPKLKSPESIAYAYRLEMKAQRLDAEAAATSNAVTKERNELRAKLLRESAEAIAVSEIAKQDGETAYILNEKVVDKETILSFFENNNKNAINRAEYEVINDSETQSLIDQRTIQLIGKKVEQTSMLKVYSYETRQQKIRERENRRNAQKSTIEREKEAVSRIDSEIQELENARQEDGSYLLENEPRSGVDYTQSRSGLLRRKKYLVSREEGDRFIREKKIEKDNRNRLIDQLADAESKIILDSKMSFEKKEGLGEVVPVGLDKPSDLKAPIEGEDLDNLIPGSFGEALLSMNLFEKDGAIGELKLDGDTVVFQYVENGVTKKTEIGNIEQLIDSSLSELGISPASINVAENGSVNVQGKSYINNYSDINSAITLDKNGNVKSVTLTDENGQNKTFTGNIAEEIAYQYALLDLDSLSEQQINDVTQELRKRVADAKKKRKVDARLARKGKRKGGKVVKARKVERKETTEEAEPVVEEPVVEEEAPAEEAPDQKAKPKKKTPVKKKAEPPVIDKETAKIVSEFKKKVNAVLESDKSLSAKVRELSTLVRMNSKKMNLIGPDATLLNNLIKAKQEGRVKTLMNQFVKKAEDRLEKPGKTKVVNAAVELKKKLKEINIAIRKAAGDTNRKRNEVIKQIRAELKELGISKTNKAHAKILSRLQRLNINNPKSLIEFQSYVEKVLEDAAFDEKLKKADNLRKKVKSSLGRSGFSDKLSLEAASFGKLKPLLVENIDEYISIAENIVESFKAIKPDRKTGHVDMPKIFNQEVVEQYVSDQNLKLKNLEIKQMRSQLEDAGIDTKGFDNSHIKALFEKSSDILSKLKSEEKAEDGITDINQVSVAEALARSFNIYKKNLMIEAKRRSKDGKGDVDFDLIKRFMEVDLTMFSSPKNRAFVITAVNQMNNFYENGDTSGMLATVAAYEGNMAVKKDLADGIRGRKSSPLGRTYSKIVNQVNLEFERAFGGINEGQTVSDNSGFTGIKNGKNKAVARVNRKFKEFNKLRGSKAINIGKYASAYNSFEQGMAGFVTRVDHGMKKEEAFKRRKSLVEQALEVEKNTDQKLYKVLKRVYDNVIKDSNSIEEVEAKMDPKNLEILNFGRKAFAEEYGGFLKMNENLRNKTIGFDLNYISDVFYSKAAKQVSSASKFNRINHDSRSSASFEAKRPYKLDLDQSISFNFGEIFYNKLKEIAIDTETAESIFRATAYTNAPEFATMSGSKETQNRIAEAINDYTARIKGNDVYISSIDSSARDAIETMLEPLFKFGYSIALVGFGQPVKQLASALFNTTTQAGRYIAGRDTAALFNPKSRLSKRLDDSGMAIVNRGADAIYEVSSNQKVANELSSGKRLSRIVSKMINFIPEHALKLSVGVVDTYGARVSFIAFYKKSLKKQGLPYGNIDWENHEWNQKALSYADMMISRNQAPSDKDLRGVLFTKKGFGYNLSRKAFIPFSSFTMAQKARFYSDIRHVLDPSTTIEDRTEALQSATGVALEMVTYHGINIAIGAKIASMVASMIGFEDDDDETIDILGFDISKKMVEEGINRIGRTFVIDILNPIPLGSNYALKTANLVIKEFGQDEEDYFTIYDPNDFSFFGTGGIAIERVLSLLETNRMANTGEYEYTSKFTGKKETGKISPESQHALKNLAILQGMSFLGMPVEVNRYVEKVKSYAKKMGEDHKFSDVYIERIYADVLEQFDMTVEDLKPYVAYNINSDGTINNKIKADKDYDEETLNYLLIHDRNEYDTYQAIKKAMEEAEYENRKLKTIDKALQDYSLEYIYSLKLYYPDQYDDLKKEYKFIDDMVNEYIERRDMTID